MAKIKTAPVKKAAPAPIGRPLMRTMRMAAAPAVAAGDPRMEAIHAAREATEIVLAELLHRSETVITADDMAELQPEIELARGTVNDCRQKEIDLTAAGTTVPPLDPASVAKLQSLAASIDVATVRNAVVTAALRGLASILNSAVRIKAMV